MPELEPPDPEPEYEYDDEDERSIGPDPDHEYDQWVEDRLFRDDRLKDAAALIAKYRAEAKNE